MVVVSYSGKEINAKLVYYGAGLSGKTTNLEAIYEAVPDTSRGKMVSMKTQSDRTLFFDLLPLDLGEIMGFKTRFLLYTVPGQVFYNATRKLVLKGADALVFVADSEVGKMEENKESLANLRANLAEYGLTLDSIPWVIQYNKRDLPNVYTVDELNAELNPAGVPSFEAVASEGKGVFETFRGVSHLLMEKVTRDLRRAPGAPARTQPQPTAHVPQPAAPVREAIAPPTQPNVLSPQPTAHGSRHEEAEPVQKAPATLPRSAAPSAPVQAIRRESQNSPAPVPDPNDIDYGVELEFGGRREPAPAPKLSEVTSNATAEAIKSVPLPRPSGSMPRPKGVSTEPTRDAHANDGEGAPGIRQIVVPVKLPPGGSYEIVIRLELDTRE